MADQPNKKALLGDLSRRGNGRARPMGGPAPDPPAPEVPAQPAPAVPTDASASRATRPERAAGRGSTHVTAGTVQQRFDLSRELSERLATVSRQERWPKRTIVEAALEQFLALTPAEINAACVETRDD